MSRRISFLAVIAWFHLQYVSSVSRMCGLGFAFVSAQLSWGHTNGSGEEVCLYLQQEHRRDMEGDTHCCVCTSWAYLLCVLLLWRLWGCLVAALFWGVAQTLGNTVDCSDLQQVGLAPG